MLDVYLFSVNRPPLEYSQYCYLMSGVHFSRVLRPYGDPPADHMLHPSYKGICIGKVMYQGSLERS